MKFIVLERLSILTSGSCSQVLHMCVHVSSLVFVTKRYHEQQIRLVQLGTYIMVITQHEYDIIVITRVQGERMLIAMISYK